MLNSCHICFQELSASINQKLLEFQKEVIDERCLLEAELKAALDELDKLHVEEEEAEKLVKQLEQENKLQTKELVRLEMKLKGKSGELERANEMHSNAIVQIQEAHNNTLCQLEEIIAEFERMLLDAQVTLAVREAEMKRTKESSIAQIAKLQAKLEEQTEEFKKRLEVERSRKTGDEKTTATLKEEIKTWRVLYEDLYNKAKPFQEQLDAYEAEKNAFLNEHGAAQEELYKLSDAYAKLLGHQNQRQKIKHVMKLKEDNAQLKQEVSKLRTQLAKEKQAHRDLQEELHEMQGIKRFDPSKAFQHDSKENVFPKTPLKEGKDGH
uniref:Hyaluronan mediated motility receptor n=1 Tax=Sphenodon punctatus TaxID=8508 RepID=A0A8D0HA38_SPHPU